MATAIERRVSGPIGEEAEVPNAHEAAGQDVEEKPAEKLLDGQRHHLAAVVIGIVLPVNAHDPVDETDEAVVGQRDAMGVAAQILQDLLGARERALGVDDPVGRAEVREDRRNAGRSASSAVPSAKVS